MTVSIEYEAEKKLDLPYEKIIKEIVEASLDFEKCPYEAEVNVILTDNETIREINRDHRQIDSATDVLSFPMVDYEAPSDFDHVEDQGAGIFSGSQHASPLRLRSYGGRGTSADGGTPESDPGNQGVYPLMQKPGMCLFYL